MKLSNENKTSAALTLCTLAGMMMHPANTIVTNLYALIPCIIACCIIEPLIKKEK
jgi:hypothetical protein